MLTRWNVDDVPVFVAVVEQNGVTAAAEKLGISKSAVSKSLKRLENSLRIRLLERNSRNIRITSEGEAFYRQGLLIIDQVKEANSLMLDMAATPSGRLVVALPMAFTREIVAPYLPDFARQFPEINLEIIVTSQSVDIIRDQIDLAVVIGQLRNSELIVKPLYSSPLACVTSPEYIRNSSWEETTRDLQEHIKIIETRYALNRFPTRVNKQRQFIDLKTGTIHVNDPITVREAIIQGFGVGLIPAQYCQTQIESGELVPIFENFTFGTSLSQISAIYPSRQLISGKTRAFLDFLIGICSALPKAGSHV